MNMEGKHLFNCKENDNQIVLVMDKEKELEVDELWFGVAGIEKLGWTVIGMNDLMAALSHVGLTLIKNETRGGEK